jgi:KaiC/GvpD/RAD55 family RecA-like ATPase
MGGLEPEHLTVIAATNKAGKTTLVANSVFHCLQTGVKALVISTETTNKYMVYRVAARLRGMDLSRLRKREFSTEEYVLLRDTVRSIADVAEEGSTLIIEDAAYPCIELIEDLVAMHSPDIVYVDHFQRLNPEHESAAQGYKRVAQVLKGTAVENVCAVVCMSQVGLTDGWATERDGVWEYDFTKMRTRWTNEIQGEADKLIFWHWLRGAYPNTGHLIYHSLRDYPSDGYSELYIDMSKMYINEAPPAVAGEPA